MHEKQTTDLKMSCNSYRRGILKEKEEAEGM